MGQRVLDVRERVGGAVGGVDVSGAEPAPGWEGAEVGDDGFEEDEELFVLRCLGALVCISEMDKARVWLGSFLPSTPSGRSSSKSHAWRTRGPRKPNSCHPG